MEIASSKFEPKEYARAWRTANRESQNAYKRTYYQENRERIRTKARAWYQENKERIAAKRRVNYEGTGCYDPVRWRHEHRCRFILHAVNSFRQNGTDAQMVEIAKALIANAGAVK